MVSPTKPTGQTLTKPVEETTVSAALDLVFDRLAVAAREGGGAITGERIGFLREEVRPEFEALLGKKESLGSPGSGRHREYGFHRLMVSHFEHLLPDQIDDVGVSRDILPGFFRALNMMLGEETVQGYHDRCQGIIDRIRAERGDRFTWQDVYDDPETKDLVLDPLVVMATYFENLDRRISWFVDLVNSQTARAGLAPVKNEAEQRPRSDWRFSEWTLQPVLAALFQQFQEVMNDDARRIALTRRYGAEACARLARLMDRIGPAEDEALMGRD